MDYKESRGVGQCRGCAHSCALKLVPVGVSKSEEIVHNNNSERLDQIFDGYVGVPVRMASKVFGNEVGGIACWGVVVNLDGVSLEETCARLQLESEKLFLQDEGALELSLRGTSNLL